MTLVCPSRAARSLADLLWAGRASARHDAGGSARAVAQTRGKRATKDSPLLFREPGQGWQWM